MRSIHVLHPIIFLLASTLAPARVANAQPVQQAPSVHIIYMGGSDCPPCVAWRAIELPKLEKSPEFASIKFSYVVKMIASGVPPSFFLPSEVKPYKEKLDFASSGGAGSPQVAVLVNGEVFDYFHGTRTAEEYQRMLTALRTGEPYPFERCVKASKQWHKRETRG